MKSFITVLALSVSMGAFALEAAKTTGPTQLDDLIRGEMAAVKTYNVVLEKVKNPSEVKSLSAMKADHVKAVATLKKFATTDIKEDTVTAGPWGTFATIFTETASLFSDKAALRALNQGEEHGVDEYNEALADKNIGPELKKEIRANLLPRQKGHVETLKKYL